MTELLTAAVIFFAYTVEGLTGFGGAITALPFLSLILGLQTSVTLVLMVSSLYGVYILIRRRRDVDWKQYLRIIGYMAIGLPVGMLLGQYLPETVLKLTLGAVTLFAGVMGFIPARRKPDTNAIGTITQASLKQKLLGALLRLCLVGGGVLQGAFATGGPLVVIYAKKMIPEKQRFRATLIVVWLTLNVVLLAMRWQSHRLGNVTPYIAYALAAWTAGILLGSFVCSKISTAQFEKVVYGLLTVSGLFMIVQTAMLS